MIVLPVMFKYLLYRHPTKMIPNIEKYPDADLPTLPAHAKFIRYAQRKKAFNKGFAVNVNLVPGFVL